MQKQKQKQINQIQSQSLLHSLRDCLSIGLHPQMILLSARRKGLTLRRMTLLTDFGIIG